MKIIHKISELRDYLKSQNKTIGFVPTMGALHSGHLSLIEQARKENELLVVSIFVNPTQFGINEDFDKYPRVLEEDSTLCFGANVDVIFAPSDSEMYDDKHETTLVCPPYSAINKLCGKSRSGHFDGVATVVTKLFNIIRPDRAYFGKKDAQQLFIIKKMVKDLNIDTQIVPIEIIREQSGLAMSSRNAYLSNKEKQEAPNIFKALETAKNLYQKGVTDKDVLCDSVLTMLTNFAVEYIEIVDNNTFEDYNIDTKQPLMLVALKTFDSNTRLIDNMELF